MLRADRRWLLSCSQRRRTCRRLWTGLDPFNSFAGPAARCAGPQLRTRCALSAADEGGICMATFTDPVGFESRFVRHEVVRDVDDSTIRPLSTDNLRHGNSFLKGIRRRDDAKGFPFSRRAAFQGGNNTSDTTGSPAHGVNY